MWIELDAGGTANFNGTGVVASTNLNQSAGAMAGNQVVTVLNTMTWSGGNLTATDEH